MLQARAPTIVDATERWITRSADALGYGSFGTGGLISCGALLPDGSVGRYVHAATRPSARTIAMRRKMLTS